MNKKVGMVRPSQVITTFGPGAIVDLPDFSVIMGGIDQWNDQTMLKYSRDIDEPRLKSKLRIRKIKSIPVAEEFSEFGTLPAYRFPQFYVCPNCRRLGTEKNFIEEEGILYCKNNKRKDKDPCPKVKTHPVRFLTACKSGHIDDFPWGFYVHSKHKKNYNYKKCILYLKDTGKSGSLADLIVRCDSCNIERSISEAFMNEKILPHCQGRRPWLGLRNKEDERCNQDRKVLLRGASNLYFPVIESSIVIPFEENPMENLVKNTVDLENEKLNDENNFRFYVEMHPELSNYDVDELWSVYQKVKYDDGSDYDLLYPEWSAITSGRSPLDDQDFEIEQVATPSRFKKYISKLIRVKRLKEVMVLKGFTRIQPVPDATMRLAGDDSEGESKEEVTMAPLSEDKLDWLPGVENYGEGIFISINEKELKKWEQENADYENAMEEAHRRMFLERDMPEQSIPPFPGIRYILLHTLSHALIRELCMHSGYSSSALKERIYSDKQKGMAGILIYTATVDSEGSLGGLVELGKTVNFETILGRALVAARYCSGDPLCAESEQSEMSDVNGAACYSCMLISETSCEKSNRYLDRSTIVQTVAGSSREFFKDV